MPTASDSPGAPSKPLVARPEKTVKPASAAARPRPLRLRVHLWIRWLHTYLSLFSLLLILFFALTGITLNHPDWAFGNRQTQTELSGQLPASWKKGAKIDWLATVEYLRTQGARGRVQEPRADEFEASVTFKAPGYTADCSIEPENGKYKMTVAAQGLVGVMNDLHRGAEAGSRWAWLIDLSGVFLAVVAFTGLGLIFYLKKIRTAGLLTIAAGAAVFLVLVKLAL